MPLGYYAVADVGRAVLLDPDRRTFKVPHMGQSLVWYAQEPRHRSFVQKVRGYIQAEGHLAPHWPRRGRGAAVRDPQSRLAIERAAIEVVTRYYEGAGYMIQSVERDRVGWDLEASCVDDVLRLEVKGRAGPDAIADLTPNEFESLSKHKTTYRVCIVTPALRSRRLSIFAYSPAASRWSSQDGRHLLITKRSGAIVEAKTASRGA